MKKIIKYVMLTLVAALFIGLFVFLYKKSRPVEVKYNDEQVSICDIQKTTIVTGKIQPRNEVNIKPQINGIISELYKRSGETVKENEVIAKLKVIPDMNSLSSAQSRVRLSEINMEQAKINFEREKSLFDKQLVSSEEFEKMQQALKQAEEECAAAKDALEVIRDGVSSTNATGSSTLVRSTISGLILDIPVKVGNSVIQANTLNEGTTVAVIANMDDLIFDGNVDETEVGSLIEGMPVKITVGALQDYSFDAVLEYVSPKAVETNGSNQFEIKAAVKVPEGQKIRSGYSANAEIVLQKSEQVLSVPESTLEFSGDTTFVYLKKGEEYEKIQVKTGLSDGLRIEVKEGISEGDVVRGTMIFEEKKK